jgi:hypothetical protein
VRRTRRAVRRRKTIHVHRKASMVGEVSSCWSIYFEGTSRGRGQRRSMRSGRRGWLGSRSRPASAFNSLEKGPNRGVCFRRCVVAARRWKSGREGYPNEAEGGARCVKGGMCAILTSHFGLLNRAIGRSYDQREGAQRYGRGESTRERRGLAEVGRGDSGEEDDGETAPQSLLKSWRRGALNSSNEAAPPRKCTAE